jgi:hypothetical protein
MTIATRRKLSAPIIGRTIDAGRQAVIDARACLNWLEGQGYSEFGIVGTSLGSYYAFLTSAHEPRLGVILFNLLTVILAPVSGGIRPPRPAAPQFGSALRPLHDRRNALQVSRRSLYGVVPAIGV